MTDDDCLHSVDSVRADHLGTCHDPKLAAVRARALKEAPAKTSRFSRIGRMQDDENALAALQSGDSRGARGAGVAGDDEIDGPGHCVRLAGGGSLTLIGPLRDPQEGFDLSQLDRFQSLIALSYMSARAVIAAV